MQEVEKHIEALIFSSENSISLLEINSIIEVIFERKFSETEIIDAIEKISNKYIGHSIELMNINGGYQFLTRKDYHQTINQLLVNRSKKKLSQAALETLSIITYKQPITKLEIEQIRGVNCDYTLQRLLEKEFISIVGKANSVGKPILYGTSNLFMDYFGINSKDELPLLKDLTITENDTFDASIAKQNSFE